MSSTVSATCIAYVTRQHGRLSEDRHRQSLIRRGIRAPEQQATERTVDTDYFLVTQSVTLSLSNFHLFYMGISFRSTASNSCDFQYH
jgi:hypothetical protein